MMAQLAWFDTQFCARLSVTLLHFLWQGLVIALLAALAASWLRRSSPRIRYGVYATSLLLMATCPLLTFCMVDVLGTPAPTGDEQERSAAREATRADFHSTLDAGTAVPPSTASQPRLRPYDDAAETRSPPATGRFEWQAYTSLVAGAYVSGVLLMLSRLLLGLYGGERLRRSSSLLDDAELTAAIRRRAKSLGLWFEPKIALCRQIVVPTVVGVLRPTILLPLCLVGGLAPEQLEVILVHELAHVRRYDHLVNLVQRLIEALLFFHPAVWFVSRRIRVEREHCCDDLVVAAGTEPLSYAISLLKVAELGQTSRGLSRLDPAAGLAATGGSCSLADRVRRLIDGRSCQPVRLGHPWASLLCASTLLAVGCLLYQCINVRAEPAGGPVGGPVSERVSRDRDGEAGHEPTHADPTVRRLLAQLRDEDWFIREQAAEVLSEIRDEALIDPLIEALNDEYTAVRQAAARGLGNIGTARAVEPLCRALDKAEDRFEIQTTIVALAEIGDPRAIEPIVAAMSREEPRIDVYSVRSIQKFRDRQIADLMVRRMKYDNGELNSNVVSMLVRLNDSRVLEPLLDSLRTSTSRRRWRAAAALGNLGDPQAVEPLIAALDDGDRRLREAAAAALGKLGDPRAHEPLAELLKREKEEDVLRSAANALGLIGDQRAVEALQPLANHGDGRVRDAITKAIADVQLGATLALRTGSEEQAVQLAETALAGGGEAAARAAARVLGGIGSPAATEALVRAVENPRAPVRSEIIGALSWIESGRAADGLARALADPDANNRWEAALVLAGREDPRALEPLLTFLEQGDDLLKRRAAECLGKLGDSSAVEPLCALLGHPERRVRSDAAQALARVANEKALDPLVEAFEKETDDRVRTSIVDALGRIHHPRAIQTLERALTDKQQDLVRRAARALARLGWKPGTEAQRVRYMMASGRTGEAGDLVPKAEPVADGNRLAGPFELDKPVLTPLSVGTAEWPEVLMIRSLEFRQKSGDLLAIVQLNQYSWPPSTWRISVQLRDDSGKVITTGEKDVRTAGVIRSQRMLMSVQPYELSLGRVADLASVRRFELAVEELPDERRPPSPLSVTKAAEAPLALAQDIPLGLEAQTPDGQRIVWTESIRFDEGAKDDKKKEIKATLRLKWASLRKADWRVWLLLLDEEGKTVARSGGRFSTNLIIKGQAKVSDESLEIPLTVWQGYREPVRFRLGLELSKDHTDAALAEQTG